MNPLSLACFFVSLLISIMRAPPSPPFPLPHYPLPCSLSHCLFPPRHRGTAGRALRDGLSLTRTLPLVPLLLSLTPQTSSPPPWPPTVLFPCRHATSTAGVWCCSEVQKGRDRYGHSLCRLGRNAKDRHRPTAAFSTVLGDKKVSNESSSIEQVYSAVSGRQSERHAPRRRGIGVKPRPSKTVDYLNIEIEWSKICTD